MRDASEIQEGPSLPVERFRGEVFKLNSIAARRQRHNYDRNAKHESHYSNIRRCCSRIIGRRIISISWRLGTSVHGRSIVRTTLIGMPKSLDHITDPLCTSYSESILSRRLLENLPTIILYIHCN
ncbi:hypothetical protein PUN28_015389 [Cardiocondyla obscurior]|uniref:Uncharacterized protein n=1 Tax=Cardiocondyla obscurior TaxID=286306 RepID=A0AAW2EU18_9HYME